MKISEKSASLAGLICLSSEIVIAGTCLVLFVVFFLLVFFGYLLFFVGKIKGLDNYRKFSST